MNTTRSSLLCLTRGVSDSTAVRQLIVLLRAHTIIIIIIINGKAIPVQARTGPEGSRRLRLPNFKTIGT